jgi:hypothetical protein
LHTENYYKKPTDFEVLQLRKVGVFNHVHISESISLIEKNKIPNNHFWEYHNLVNGTQCLVCPVLVEKKYKYSGTFPRKKVKSVSIKLSTSAVSYTAHALSRFYERTRTSQLSCTDFFIPNSHWFEILYEISLSFNWVNDHTAKTPFIVPFRNGALLGKSFSRPDDPRVEYICDVKRRKFKEKRSMPMPQSSYAAHTFIGEHQMGTSQLEILYALQSEDLERAAAATIRLLKKDIISVRDVFRETDFIIKKVS